ncbi:MAG: response regulator [Verrucomicrobia bacterium]|nr:response regulator [Verrucomicrobiota bacterium]
MSYRAKAIVAVLIAGFLCTWTGWVAHSRSVEGPAVVVLGALIALGVMGVGSWLAASASKGEFSARVRGLVAHLQQVREQGDYSLRRKIQGDDEVAQVAQHLDAVLDVVVHRLDELRKRNAALEGEAVQLKTDLVAAQARTGEEIRRKQQAEEAMMKALTDFERGVRERTEELSAANDALVEEVSQRTHAESALPGLHLELEERVNERTLELALANEMLLKEIEDRRKSEVAIKELEERFSKAFHASPAGAAILRCDTGVIVEINRSFLGSLERSQAEVTGRSMAELELWDEPQAEVRFVDELRRKGSLSGFHCRWRTRKGEPRELRISAEPMEVGSVKCVLLVVEDITEKMKLEDQLRQSQKMEAVGQLAAGIAHDFNNILTVVQGHAELLRGEAKDSTKAVESIECVSSAADRAAKLTRQLLTFSRKQVVQWCELDLNRVVQDLAGMLRSLLRENIRLDFYYHDQPPMVRGDSNMIDQVLLNLVVNARDAMPQGGVLTVDTSLVTLDEEAARKNPKAREGRFVCLTVMDSGCGMSASILERIFEPFFTTKEFGQGTGLGLATVYGVVSQHNGWIDVQSTPGAGTLFRVYFPALAVKPPKQEGPPGRQDSKAGGGTETVLVVEDEMGLRMLVEAVLKKHGYRVMVAENGVDALRVWTESGGRIDLLLTDMVMPGGISGLDLSERLRGFKQDLRVVYMSGYSTDFMDNGAEGVQEGVNFLQKPYKPDQLVRVVRQVLDQEAQPLPRRGGNTTSDHAHAA